MLNVYINNMFFEEKSYIIEQLFSFCKIPYQIKEDIEPVYRITNGERSIIVNDAFFFKQTNSSYMSLSNIPRDIQWFTNTLQQSIRIPMIYGEDKLLYSNDIYCGLDVFASAFFMLTRWEELVLPKDKHGRCDEDHMFVVKHNIYNRPIVNEYIELLKLLLIKIGVKVPESKLKFTPFITHDIDALFRYASLKNFGKNIVGDIVHRKSLKILASTLVNFVKYKFNTIKDPFDTFDYLMDISDEHGLKNHFYFMPTVGGKGEVDVRYNINDKQINAIIENIVERGHYIGIHPSKNTFHNEKQFRVEVDRLKKISTFEGGRQHYLLYDLPETIRFWHECGLKYDAGLGFYKRAGFRCGICYEYNFFDVIKRETLDFKIKPLIFMEAALLPNQNIDKVYKIVKFLIETVKKYNGLFVFLWHNDNFNRIDTKSYKLLYKKIVKKIYY